MKNGIFKLGWSDLLDSIVTAVFVAVITAIGGVVLSAGFDVFSADWVGIGRNVVNIGFVAFIGQLVNNLVSDNSGKVFGVIG